MDIIDQAKYLLNCGYSVFPIKVDGSKHPACKWGEWQERAMSPEEADKMFGEDTGIGIASGYYKGSTEILNVLDFEFWDEFLRFSEAAQAQKIPVYSFPVVKTAGGGAHVYFLSDKQLPSGVLAKYKEPRYRYGDKSSDIIVETRVQGHYVVAPGNPRKVHSTKDDYSLVAGDMANPPYLNDDDQESILEIIRDISEVEVLHVQRVKIPNKVPQRVSRPGDMFNQNGPEWHKLLEHRGFTFVDSGEFEGREVSYWARPNKRRPDKYSVSVNYVEDCLYTFTDTIPQLDMNRAYDKFSFITFFDFGGDFSAAAKWAADAGYQPEVDSIFPDKIATFKMGESKFRLYWGDKYLDVNEDMLDSPRTAYTAHLRLFNRIIEEPKKKDWVAGIADLVAESEAIDISEESEESTLKDALVAMLQEVPEADDLEDCLVNGVYDDDTGRFVHYRTIKKFIYSYHGKVGNDRLKVALLTSGFKSVKNKHGKFWFLKNAHL